MRPPSDTKTEGGRSRARPQTATSSNQDVLSHVACELVSNAVRHTKGPAALRVRWSAGVLRIGAWDANPEPPEPPVPLEQIADAEEGRGLGLVRACADLWGWQPLTRDGNRGKVVWCELAAA